MFKNKTVIVTGGASGLGRTLTEQFVAEGANVVFTYFSSEDKAKSLMEKYPKQVFGVQADATDYDKAQEVAKIAFEKFGRIDILVNNASAAKHGEFVHLTFDDFDFSIKNGLYPVFNYSKAVTPYFIDQKDGCIVNIGSINGMRGRQSSLPYCAAKAGIEGLTKTYAKEMGEYNIRCNVVAPGFIYTDAQIKTSAIIKKLVLDECAIRRLTKPEEVGHLVLFLAGDKAQNMTGQVFQIDCGQYI